MIEKISIMIDVLGILMWMLIALMSSLYYRDRRSTILWLAVVMMIIFALEKYLLKSLTL